MRVEIARLHNEIGATMIYVTHDQVEAMTLADKIVVLRGGRIEQVGAPLTLYDDPDNEFVAGFIGSPRMNFFEGEAVEGGVRVPALGGLTIPTGVRANGRGLRVGVRPEHLRLTEGDALRLDLAEHLGGVSYVHLVGSDGSRMIAEARDVRGVQPGMGRGVAVEPGKAYFFDPESGQRVR
jgi:lactose/L-arabinose transport system ATP-binding protein